MAADASPRPRARGLDQRRRPRRGRGPAASSPSRSAGRSSSSSSTRPSRWSGGWSGATLARMPHEVPAPRERPTLGARPRASTLIGRSSATPSRSSRRRSPGRCASGAGSTPDGVAAFLRHEAAIAVARPATATAPGSSATRSRPAARPSAAELRAGSPGVRRAGRRARPPAIAAAAAGRFGVAATRRSRSSPSRVSATRRSARMTDPVGRDHPPVPIEDELRSAVPRLRHERHRQPRAAGRARRPQAGPPPHPLHDERDGPRGRRRRTASAPRSSAR